MMKIFANCFAILGRYGSVWGLRMFFRMESCLILGMEDKKICHDHPGIHYSRPTYIFICMSNER